MPPQSHEEMIREFARMVGNTPTDGNSRRKLILKKIGAEAARLGLALLAVLVTVFMGWVFLLTLHDIGAIGIQLTFLQALGLLAPPLFFILTVPFTFNVRIKQ